NPWASPDIPSWVYLENGKVVGTIGVIPRPMEFRGKPIRAAITTQFIVDPEHRGTPIATRLLRRCFEGPQEMTWTDGAAEPASKVWVARGCHQAPLYAFHWGRFLRPFAAAPGVLSRNPDTKWLGAVARVLAVPADVLARPFLRPPPSVYPRHAASAAE